MVVTRYFGGTLLGTGGLVRAYSKATKMGLDNSILVDKVHGTQLKIGLDYSGAQKVKHIISQLEVYTIDTLYTDVVEEIVVVEDEKLELLKKQVKEVTNGNSKFEVINSGYFAIKDNKVIG